MGKNSAAFVLLLTLACGTSPSSPETGQTPVLTSPANGDSLEGPDVTCSWDAVTGATRYYLQMDSDPSMQSPEQTVTTGSTITVTPPESGSWWWRVRASVTGQSTYTPWSEVWEFTI